MLAHLIAIHGIVCGGEHQRVLQRGQHVAAQHLDLADAVDLVAKKLDAQGVLALVGGDDLQYVAPDAKAAAHKIKVVAGVLDLNQPLDELAAAHLHAGTHAHHHALVLAGVAHGIDAAHAGNDDDVLALAHGGGGGVAQAVDLLVDGGVLFDVGIGGGDVGLRLIIVVVAHKVFHRAVREEGAQLAAQLGCQRFVVRQHQRGLLHPFDDGGHGKGLAAAGNAQQHLIALAAEHAVCQRLDGGGLIAAGGIGSLEHKTIHGGLPFINRRCS